VKFPYRRYSIQPSLASIGRTTIARPVIPVKFSGPRRMVDSYALLDTGADESYITSVLAKQLGVTPISRQPNIVESASGDLSVLYGEVIVQVGRGPEIFSRQIVVGIVDEPWSEAILGNIGFLEYFDALFSFPDRYVMLTPRN